MTLVFKHIHYLPVLVFVWFPFTFILMYIIAVLLEDVNPVFPYISDTGTFSPESCIFGQMLNTGSILLAIVIYVRYRQVRDVNTKIDASSLIIKLNTTCLWLGMIAAFGISIVANFQETNLFIVHLIGAGMTFGLGGIYLLIQTFISFRIYPTLGNNRINYIRAVISVMSNLFSSLTFFFGLLSFLRFTGDDITKWSEKDGGYEYHLVSTVSEWITAILTMAYILTITGDFKRINVYEPAIEIKERYVKENSINTVDRF